LAHAGYRVAEIVPGPSPRSRRRGRQLARGLAAVCVAPKTGRLEADLIWFCMPDSAISAAARQWATAATSWKGKDAFHSSGVVDSSALAPLKRRGARLASVHPFMTFVSQAMPSLRGVPFAIEGDAAAVRLARQMVRDLGGEPFAISSRYKTAYHAWGTFAS